MREDNLARNSVFGASHSQRLVVLTTVSALALCATQPALAQTTEDPPEAAETEDAIIVTGFKKSLESAQNIKRDADTFDDSEFYQTLLKEFLEGSGDAGAASYYRVRPGRSGRRRVAGARVQHCHANRSRRAALGPRALALD